MHFDWLHFSGYSGWRKSHNHTWLDDTGFNTTHRHCSNTLNEKGKKLFVNKMVYKNGMPVSVRHTGTVLTLTVVSQTKTGFVIPILIWHTDNRVSTDSQERYIYSVNQMVWTIWRQFYRFWVPAYLIVLYLTSFIGLKWCVKSTKMGA